MGVEDKLKACVEDVLKRGIEGCIEYVSPVGSRNSPEPSSSFIRFTS